MPLPNRLHLPALRTGLLGRLVIAFGLVVVFVWIANEAATNGGTIVRVSEPPVASVFVIRKPVALPDTRRDERKLATDRAASLVHVAGFLSALGTFEHAVERRAVEGVRYTASMNGAQAALKEQATLVEHDFSEVESARAPAVRAVADARRLMEGARELIAQADARRQASASYWQAVDVLDTELKTALDKTWKILGRVIARESLVAMNRRADEIRRLSSRLLLDGSLDAQGHEDLARAQSELAAQLDDLVKRNGGAKNGAWMTRAREALQIAIGARVELAQIEGVSRNARDAMDRSHASLDRAVRGLTETIESLGENSRTMPSADRADEGMSNPAPVPPASGPMRVTSDGTSLVTRTYESPTSDARVTWLRWASAAILITLLAVCFWIVGSVVHPVRAFASTIARLSKGELSARFKPAGIRELDTLATAFNQMAEELSRAQLKSREYQTELEERVDERTRQLRHLADHDELTALPNRRQLTWHLDLTLARATRAGSRVGVFFLDLDNFKTINDSMGHAYGDLVLQAIAQRLRNAIPANAFAARLGGDEFTMIHEAATAEELLEVGQALAVAFQKPHLVEDRELVVGVSLGASIFPDHESEAAALLRAADAALFSAKSAGRSRLAVFEPALLQAASLKFRIEQGLRRAVERGEFELLFQPEISLERLDTVLVEALLRWRRPDGQYVSPSEFLVVAEESGLIMTISDWVMRASIEQAAIWYHGAWRQVRVAINVSARQLLDPRFDERVMHLLEQYHLPASCIEIELTETVLQTGEATIAMLRRLRTMGISIALDDFGTGYSTLASIEQLPLTRVKMDRSLIAEIDRRSRSLAIARAIIALCRDLGLAVTAEGVERAEQLALLAEEPGLTLQGYLIDSPVPADSVADAVATMPARLQSLLLTMPASPHREAQLAQPPGAKSAAG